LIEGAAATEVLSSRNRRKKEDNRSNLNSRKRGLIEGAVTTEVLSYINRRKKDRIGERQPFRERSVWDKIRPGRELNSRPNAYKADELQAICLG
jgi:hypothetical protein